METSSRSTEFEPEPEQPSLEEGYSTQLGTMYVGTIEGLLASPTGRGLKGKTNLIFTSPPFPLNHKKRYGNKIGDEYLDWLCGLAPRLVDLLTDDGSIVMELGNAWEPGRPVMSTLAMRALLGFLDAGELNLCQQFVCHNPSRLPSPAQWVNVDRIRVKDSFTHVWWMAPSDRPKANNRNILTDYSPAMRKLLRTGKYNAGTRPSGHRIGETSFKKDNGGAIPPNVLDLFEEDVPANLLEISNTRSADPYRRFCREYDIEAHPAPMQPELADFFIRFLTDEQDLVLDPFGGSNTTGAAANALNRKWIATEPTIAYVEGSMARFPELNPD